MKAQQLEAEKRLDKVVEWARQQGDEFDPLTARRDLGVSDSESQWHKPDGVFSFDGQPSNDFRILEDRGVFRRLPGERQPEWKLEAARTAGAGRNHGMGRGTKFYTFPKAEPTPVTKEPESGPATVAIETPTLEQVRDAAIALKLFQFKILMERLGLPSNRLMRNTVREHMSTLVQRGIFKDVSEQGVTGLQFQYIEPKDEGAGSRVERMRTPEPPRRERSEPVALAQRIKASNEATQRILDAVYAQWGNVAEKTGGGHIRIIAPNGDRVYISSTPGSRNTARENAKLRRAGLKI